MMFTPPEHTTSGVSDIVQCISMKHNLDARYWEQRYRTDDTPWDIEGVSPALMHYFETHLRPGHRILIPGAGRAHEAVWLHRHGHRDVTVCDLTDSAFGYMRQACPDFPPDKQYVGDFFEMEGSFDVIIEQTFFCALDPGLRNAYALKSANLLVAGGELAGLLFASPFQAEGPPFGGTAEEYRTLLAPHFDILEMDICPLSIQPRLGNELFFRCRKR